MGGKGLGAVALRHLPAGTVLVREDPLIHYAYAQGGKRDGDGEEDESDDEGGGGVDPNRFKNIGEQFLRLS